MKRRKPWRNYKKHYITKGRVRWICVLMLVLEGFIMSRQGLIALPAIEVREDSQIVIYQVREGQEINGTGEPDGRVYGIRIRIKEGTLEFYESTRETLVKP